MTCFISDLTSDNHLALSLSFSMSLPLSHIQGHAFDAPGLFVEDSSSCALMLTVCVYLKRLKMFVCSPRSTNPPMSQNYCRVLVIFLSGIERATFFFFFFLHSAEKTRGHDRMPSYVGGNNEIWHCLQVWDHEVVEGGWQEMTEQFNLGAGLSRSEKTWQAQHTLLPTPKATNMSVFPEKSAMWKQKCLAVGSREKLREGGEGANCGSLIWVRGQHGAKQEDSHGRWAARRQHSRAGASLCSLWHLHTPPSRTSVTVYCPTPVWLQPWRKSQGREGEFMRPVQRSKEVCRSSSSQPQGWWLVFQ